MLPLKAATQSLRHKITRKRSNLDVFHEEIYPGPGHVMVNIGKGQIVSSVFTTELFS